MPHATTRRPTLRVALDGTRVARPDMLAVEEPLEIRIDGAPFTITMRTPGHDLELALGFLVAESVLHAPPDVVRAMHCADADTDADGRPTYNVVTSTWPPVSRRPNRPGTGTSAVPAGSAGRRASTRSGPAARPWLPTGAGTRPRWPPCRAGCEPRSAVFDRTGGLHAAACSPPPGSCSACGRTSGGTTPSTRWSGWAFGHGLLPLHGHVLQVSGRASFELVQKAWLAGCPLLAAVSAPSSLAANLAERGRDDADRVLPRRPVHRVRRAGARPGLSRPDGSIRCGPMNQHPTAGRPPSAVDALAERYLEDQCRLDPVGATQVGALGFDTELTDYSPAGHADRDALNRRTLAELDAVDAGAAGDEVDAVTVAALRERIGAERAWHDTGMDLAELNNNNCPVQQVREVFDLSPTVTVEDWDRLATRLAAVPDAMAGFVRSLHLSADRGRTAAARQVRSVAAEANQYGGGDGFFATLGATTHGADGTPLPEPVRHRLGSAAAAAGTAYLDLAGWLRTELLPRAPERDPAGIEHYPLHLRRFLGTEVDPAETYAWGLAELARIEGRMLQVARRVVPGAAADTALAAATAALDAEPGRWVEGAEAFRDWMQQLSDAAIEQLAGRHFQIDPPLRALTCRISPSTSGIVYYTGPTEDLSRPGQMWWAVPAGITRFSTWRETSTIYHEGVPGHHLQIAHAAYQIGQLNRWRRIGCWVSGHGEGWALYAERLMDELGYLSDPGDEIGMLDMQALRAARVVVDIGVHCELAAPDEVGGGTWDAAKAWEFLRRHTRMPEPNLRFELERYLGWPGQAPSYKIGERVWLELREQVRATQGADFDLATFHRRALDLGSVGLDVLRGAVLAGAAAR